MKLLAVSDIHDRIGRVSSLYDKLRSEGFAPDVVIVAGDITYFKDLGTAVRVLKRFRDLFGCMVLFVPGNCDSRDLLGVGEVEQGVVNIHAKVFRVEDYVFYGIGGSGITPHNTWIEYSENEFRSYLETLREHISRGCCRSDNLVVVSHQPIYSFFDELRGEKLGSKAFYEYLREIQPVLWVTGHMHEYSGWTTHGKTTIVHPGPLMHGRYALVELDEGRVKYVRIDRLEGV